MQKHLKRMYESILTGIAAIPLTYFGWLYAEWRAQTGGFLIYSGVFFGMGVGFMLLGFIGSIVNWRRYRRYRAAHAINK
jgi:hypothetical protein